MSRASTIFSKSRSLLKKQVDPSLQQPNADTDQQHSLPYYQHTVTVVSTILASLQSPLLMHPLHLSLLTPSHHSFLPSPNPFPVRSFALTWAPWRVPPISQTGSRLPPFSPSTLSLSPLPYISVSITSSGLMKGRVRGRTYPSGVKWRESCRRGEYLPLWSLHTCTCHISEITLPQLLYTCTSDILLSTAYYLPCNPPSSREGWD